MSGSSSRSRSRSLRSLMRAPRAEDIDGVEKEQFNHNSEEKLQQILRFKPPHDFKLPDDWVVEERPRPSNSKSSCRIDRYYYEPGTGRQFRSLPSVQRYLAEKTKDSVTPERIISENEDYSGVKSRTGQRSARGVRSYEKSATKRSSVAEEEGFTPTALKFSVESTPTKTDSQRKFHLGKDHRGSIHNLSRPPEKVSWVLSGPGGSWSPFVDDTIVPEPEKLKWAEAFVQSIHNS